MRAYRTLLLVTLSLLVSQAYALGLKGTATITWMYEMDYMLGSFSMPSSSTMLGVPVAVGDQVVFGGSYDEASANTWTDYNGTADGSLLYAVPVSAFSLTLPSSGFQHDFSNPLALAVDKSFLNASSLSLMYDSTDTTGTYGTSLVFRDYTNTAFTGFSLPTDIDLSKYQEKELSFFFSKAGTSQYYGFGARFDTLSAGTPTPDLGSTSCLLLLGLLGLRVLRPRLSV